MFFASMRWLALESRLLMTGDMQRLSLGRGTGEVAVDVDRVLPEGKDKLV